MREEEERSRSIPGIANKKRLGNSCTPACIVQGAVYQGVAKEVQVMRGVARRGQSRDGGGCARRSIRSRIPSESRGGGTRLIDRAQKSMHARTRRFPRCIDDDVTHQRRHASRPDHSPMGVGDLLSAPTCALPRARRNAQHAGVACRQTKTRTTPREKQATNFS